LSYTEYTVANRVSVRFSVTYLYHTSSTMQRPTLMTNPNPNPNPSPKPNPSQVGRCMGPRV